MTIVALPAIIGGIWIVQVFRLVILKDKKETFFAISLPILLLIGIALLYYGYIKDVVTTRTSAGIAAQPIIFSLELILTKVKFFIGLWILIVILYAPWSFAIRKNLIDIQTLIFLLGIITSGAIYWTLVSPGVDVFQFFTHVSFAILNCIITLCIVFLFLSYKNSKTYFFKIFVALGLLMWCAINQFRQQKFIYSFTKNYDRDYLYRIQTKVDTMSNGVGVSLLPPNYKFDASALSEQLGDYLLVMRPLFYTITISNFDMYTLSDVRRKDLALMAFTQFVNRQQAEGTFQSIPQSQADFIRKHRMGYLIASKSAIIPPTIQPMITDSIVDSKSGERFYLLKP
jgi:hypothetical protein